MQNKTVSIIVCEVINVYEDFVRERITQLRLKKGVSEYQMSYDLGHSRRYVYNISSGKALPPLKEFFGICDYFGITPQKFFDECTPNPELVQKALEGIKNWMRTTCSYCWALLTAC